MINTRAILSVWRLGQSPRRWRFSLRFLFVLTIVCAAVLVFGMKVHQAREAARHTKCLSSLGIFPWTGRAQSLNARRELNDFVERLGGSLHVAGEGPSSNSDPFTSDPLTSRGPLTINLCGTPATTDDLRTIVRILRKLPDLERSSHGVACAGTQISSDAMITTASDLPGCMLWSEDVLVVNRTNHVTTYRCTDGSERKQAQRFPPEHQRMDNKVKHRDNSPVGP